MFSLLLFSLHPSAVAEKELTSFSITESPWFPSDKRILVSQNETIAAGFRAIPPSFDRFFFAVWVQHSSDQTVVWSLNHDSPVGGSSDIAISSTGVLSLNDSSGRNIWQDAVGNSSNDSRLVLGESGNLVFGNWSSFNFPTDTILANQPLQTMNLTSGDYHFVNATSLVFKGSDKYWQANDVIRNLSSKGQLLMDKLSEGRRPVTELATFLRVSSSEERRSCRRGGEAVGAVEGKEKPLSEGRSRRRGTGYRCRLRRRRSARRE